MTTPTGFDLALTARTEAGQKFVALCEAHGDDFRTRAAAHDRDASFPHENIAAMRDSGVLAAAVPQDLGGLGVTAAEELLIGVSRIARGDASTAIALAMHLGPCWSITRMRRRPRPDPLLADYLRMVATGDLVLCGAGTEAGTHTRFPMTEATRTEAGWTLTGTKIFATLSPAATAFNVFCRVRQPDGGWHAARAWIPRGTPGLEIVENWDAMGMRASGSHELRLRDCVVPDGLLSVRGPWGEWSVDELTHSIPGNLILLSAYLGIAEEARELTRVTLLRRKKAPSGRLLAERPAIQMAFARIEANLLVCRAVVQRVSRLVDDYLGAHADAEIPISDAHHLMAEFQCAKTTVEQNAIALVDTAMTASGGAGYLSGNPLSRLYRDVRAGPFMQPFSPIELFEYVGRVRLDRDPAVDL